MEMYGTNFFSQYTTELIVTRREGCIADVMVRYLPPRPGGAFMLRIDGTGKVFDTVNGI